MGRIDPQGYGNIVSAYFDIDPNAGKPTILSTPIPYKPKSILLDDQGRYVKWNEVMRLSSALVKSHESS